MQSSVSFSGLSLTEIFEIQSLQSLLIKFWYLGMTSDFLIAKEDATTFRVIKKSLNFANCFTFEMPMKTYVNFIDRIMVSIIALQPKQIFDELLGHLRNNKIASVSFQLFGVALLQLFGRVLEYLDSFLMSQILRRVYVQITVIGKSGTAHLKVQKSTINEIDFQEFIPDFKSIKSSSFVPSGTKHQAHNNANLMNPEQSIEFNKSNNLNTDRDLKTLKGRLESQQQLNSSMREQSGHYPTGEKMKNKQKANISCFMMGGFEIVDYSDSINQLHKKLLTKILLNR